MIERPKRLACTAPVQAEARFPAQRRAIKALFSKPLRVDHGLVRAGAESLAQLGDLPPGCGAARVPAPAPECDRNDLGYGGVQRRNLRAALLHRPVDLDVGEAFPQVGGHRQIVHHVPERGGLDQEDPAHRCIVAGAAAALN